MIVQELPKSLVRAVKFYYREPHRHYHDWSHVRHMFAVARQLKWRLTLAEKLAILFHDAVHVPGATFGANEQMSALLMKTLTAGLGFAPEVVAAAADMIHATADHDAAPGAERVCDLDFAILAAPLSRYRHYARGVRAEYPMVSGDDFARGRADFLRALLARPAIYRTPEAAAAFEATARRNVAAELKMIGREA